MHNRRARSKWLATVSPEARRIIHRIIRNQAGSGHAKQGEAPAPYWVRLQPTTGPATEVTLLKKDGNGKVTTEWPIVRNEKLV